MTLYNKFINIDDEKIKEKESLFFDILEDILGICKQEKYSPVEPAINRAIKYALNQTPINYDLMIKMLNKLDVKLLSDKPFVSLVEYTLLSSSLLITKVENLNLSKKDTLD